MWKSHTSAMEKIYKQGDEFMKSITDIASTIPARISTITIAVKTDTNEFSLKRIQKDFNSGEIQNFIYEVTGNKSSIAISTKKQFNNSIIFKCNNIPTEEDGYVLDKQAVKVFCNGSLHITGVKNIKDALYLAEIFVTMIELIYGGNGVSGMFKIVGFEVQLINLYLKLQGMMDDKSNVLLLVDVLKKLRETTTYSVSYNNERHAGVIVRSPTFSILIFDTGNVIICSIKESSDLIEAKQFLQDKVFPLTEYCMTTLHCSMFKKIKRESKDFDYAKYLILK